LENSEYGICKYCHKPKQKVDCIKEGRKLMGSEDGYSFHEAIAFVLWFLSLFFDSFKKRLDNHKFKVTCYNKDCIGYLEGCYVNKCSKEYKLKL